MDTIVSDTIEAAVQNTATIATTHNVWMWVALVEFVILLILCICLLQAKRKPTERDEIKARVLKEGDIDFDNIINSSFKAKALYDELKGVCHPDKFAKDGELNAKATEIFALLVKNKYDYAALCELKERAERELNVKFK